VCPFCSSLSVSSRQFAAVTAYKTNIHTYIVWQIANPQPVTEHSSIATRLHFHQISLLMLKSSFSLIQTLYSLSLWSTDVDHAMLFFFLKGLKFFRQPSFQTTNPFALSPNPPGLSFAVSGWPTLLTVLWYYWNKIQCEVREWCWGISTSGWILHYLPTIAWIKSHPMVPRVTHTSDFSTSQSGLHFFMLTSFRFQCGEKHKTEEVHILAPKAFSCSIYSQLQWFVLFLFCIRNM